MSEVTPALQQKHSELMVRFTYAGPLGKGLVLGADPIEIPLAFAPRDMARVFRELDRLFQLSVTMARADVMKVTATERSLYPHSGVRRVHLGSPLEVIIALMDALATPKVIRCCIDLIAEAYTLDVRIHRDRARRQAEQLAAEVEAMHSTQALVRLGADVLRETREDESIRFRPPGPAAVDLWIGGADEALQPNVQERRPQG